MKLEKGFCFDNTLKRNDNGLVPGHRDIPNFEGNKLHTSFL